MTTYVDIPGLVAIEQNYLLKTPALGDGKHNDQLYQINNQINKLSDVLSTNGGKGIITQQTQMSNIVNEESARLATKQQSIATAVESQNRLITLNENYSKRYAEYIKIILALAFGLAIIVILIIFHVSSGLITIAAIGVGSFVLIYITFVYSNISSRDNVYFDELNMNSMSTPASASAPAHDTSGNLLDLLDLSCFGSSCCSTGTAWDVTSQLCKTIPVETFRNVVSKEKPWLPNEYESYTKI